MTELRVRTTEPRAGALVDDVVFDGPDGEMGRTSATEVLQYGSSDFYIPMMSALELQSVAPEGTELRRYDGGHDRRSPAIRADRRAFLARVLALRDE